MKEAVLGHRITLVYFAISFGLLPAQPSEIKLLGRGRVFDSLTRFSPIREEQASWTCRPYIHTEDSDERDRAKQILEAGGAEDISFTGESSVPKADKASEVR
jgi:hypothetical protein